MRNRSSQALIAWTIGDRYRRLILLLFVIFLPSLASADFIRVEQNHASVTYEGNWTTYSSPRVHGGSLVAASAAGARATITFTGTGIRWISYGCPCAPGSAHVYLDGVLQLTTNPVPAWADTEPKLQKFEISGLANTTHSLTIEVAGQLPGWGSPTTGAVPVDAFLVETGAQTRLIEESDTSISYTGTWTEIDDPGVSSGSVLASREPGATATVRFNGTGISWISYLCPCTGNARVVFPFADREVNTNASARLAQAMVYNSTQSLNIGGPLPAGDHQLRVEVVGDSSTNPWVVIDAFRIMTGSSDGPDTTPPEVVIRVPAQGATVSGEVDIIADLFDSRPNGDQFDFVQRRHFVDGVEIQVREAGLFPRHFYWDTRTVSDGQHVLTMIGRDQAGNETLSAPVTVTVNNANVPDQEPPQVTMTAPANNASVTGIATLSASALDNVGVTRVAFFAADGTLIGEDSTAPYSITRDTSSIPSGRTIRLLARAYDAAGNVGTSAQITVTVQH